MTGEVERRVRRANPITRDHQLDQLFAEPFSEQLLEDIRARRDGRAVDTERRLGHLPLSATPGSTRAAARPASEVSRLRPALIGFLLVMAGAAALWMVRPEQPDVATPSPPVFWDADRQHEDWPGPLREEPIGPVDVLIVDPGEDGVYGDTVGDTVLAVVDVVSVSTRVGCWRIGSNCTYFDLANTVSSMPDPRQEWIAYGIVVDYTGDGIPDARYGIDNAVGISEVRQPGFLRRMWWTDLASGTTVVPVCCEDLQLMDAVFPPEFPGDDRQTGSIYLVGQPDEEVFHVYVWASAIRDGQVIATDYAPDSGWIAVNP